MSAPSETGKREKTKHPFEPSFPYGDVCERYMGGDPMEESSFCRLTEAEHVPPPPSAAKGEE